MDAKLELRDSKLAIIDWISDQPEGLIFGRDGVEVWDHKISRYRHPKNHIITITGIWKKKPLAIIVEHKSKIDNEKFKMLELIASKGGIAFVACSIKEVIEKLKLSEQSICGYFGV